MYLSDFNYHRPKNIKEALHIINSSENGAFLAGGTDLLVEMKNRKRFHEDLVSLTGINELKKVYISGSRLYIGPLATYNDLIHSPVINDHCPVIREAASSIATEQIRNIATVGGNLCTAASCSDMAPILLALAGNVDIVDVHGRKSVKLEDFFVAHKKTILRKGEMLTGIAIDITNRSTGSAYLKFGLREAASIAVASVAAVIEIEDHICKEAKVVLGAVAPTPIFSTSAEAAIKNKDVTEIYDDKIFWDHLGRAAADDSKPLDDIRGSAEYRRNIIKILAQKAVKEAIGRTGAV